MSITTRGEKPLFVDAPLISRLSTNIGKPGTTLLDEGYATQDEPGSDEWNWVTNYVSAGVLHCFIYGIAIWDVDETYVENTYINRNGVIYKSRVGTNLGNVPESSPNQWHDIRKPLPIEISSSGSHSVQTQFNEVLKVDSSGGVVNLSVGVGQFDGQTIAVEVTGGNVCNVTASGTSSQPVSGGYRYTLRWNGSSYMMDSIQGELSGLNSSQFFRSDVADTKNGTANFNGQVNVLSGFGFAANSVGLFEGIPAPSGSFSDVFDELEPYVPAVGDFHMCSFRRSAGGGNSFMYLWFEKTTSDIIKFYGINNNPSLDLDYEVDKTVGSSVSLEGFF